jgi:hypothetical protein
MAEDIVVRTLEDDTIRDEAIQAIVKQLRQHPVIQQIIKPIITVDCFKSAFKCVSEKTASYYSGRVYHQTKHAQKVKDMD